MSVIHNDLLLSSDEGGYNIAKSLRTRASASASLSRTPSTGNRRTWTWSGWVKRGTLGSTQHLFDGYNGTAGETGNIRFESSNALAVYTGGDSGSRGSITTTAVFRDPSAWYHIVAVVDTTQSTSSDRMKLYVNGVQQVVTVNQTVTQNYDGQVNGNWSHRIGSHVSNINYFDGYLTEVNFIDGQALTQSSFGETDAITGVWKPKRFSGTYGTNGFYLPFTDVATTSGSNAGLGKDFSGNGNYWTTNNISVTSGATYDSMKDVPTLTDTDTANYCVINAVNTGNVSGFTCSDGNLKWSPTTLNNWSYCLGTFGVSSGKWYWEGTMALAGEAMFGITLSSNYPIFNTPGGYSSSSYAYYNANGQKFTNSSGSSYGATWTAGDVIGIAFDADSGSLTFYKNNTSQGVAFSSIPAGTYSPQNACTTNGVSGQSVTMNFGQRPFAYTPPTGFKALNTYNLPDSNIVAGNTVMDATTYIGNGSTQSITNAAGFKPDLIWTKSRSNAMNNQLQSSLQGADANGYLTMQSDATYGEPTFDASWRSTYGKVTAINSNGFTVAAGSSNGGFNTNGWTYVGWQWQAGQGTTSSNTSGSITSTVSVNASAGFSVVSYSGNNSSGSATIGHGLGVAPSMIIAKNRDQTGDWCVYHKDMNATPQNYYMQLNLTSSAGANSTIWNNTAPTSSVLSVGSYLNGNTIKYVAYCWTDIAGYSKFGKYTGNGSSDGAFVYTGFKPKFVLLKVISTGTGENSWFIIDSNRNTYNVLNSRLVPNSSGAEASDINIMDFTSNGFKLRDSNWGWNENGTGYIYAAFAENPFKNSLAR